MAICIYPTLSGSNSPPCAIFETLHAAWKTTVRPKDFRIGLGHPDSIRAIQGENSLLSTEINLKKKALNLTIRPDLAQTAGVWRRETKSPAMRLDQDFSLGPTRAILDLGKPPIKPILDDGGEASPESRFSYSVSFRRRWHGPRASSGRQRRSVPRPRASGVDRQEARADLRDRDADRKRSSSHRA